MATGGALARGRFVFPAAVYLAVIAAAPAPSAAAVFGRDDRTPLRGAHTTMAKKIGALTSSNTGALCTAFCLAPDIIATAAHCLFGAEPADRPALADLKFELSFPGAPATARIAGGAVGNQDQNIIAGSRRLRLSPPISAARDWAMARLETPVCQAGGLALASSQRDAPAGDHFQIAGHRDRPESPLLLSRDCGLPAEFSQAGAVARDLQRDFSSWRNIALHRCDTGGGSSGSPLLVEHKGDAIVTGLNVGTYFAARGVISAADGAPLPRAPIANTAISVAPLAAALKALAARDLLTTYDDVARVQFHLAKRGLFEGDINGRVDDELIAAVRRYERRSGAPVTGLVTHRLLIEFDRAAR